MAEAIGALILAGVEAAGVAGAAAYGATTIIAGLTVATAVGTAAVLGISVAVAFATAPDVPRASDGSQPLRQSIPPRAFGYGRCRLSGSYMLFEVDPDTNDSYDVLAVHQGRIGGVVLLYLADDLVHVNGSGFVDALLNVDEPAAAKRYAWHNADSVVIKTALGLATETAFADVVATLPTLWTSAHRGDGVASLMLRCDDIPAESIPKVYPRGLPKPSIVADLSPIWDPRDPGQDREDPDTWAVSSNPVLQLLDYLTHPDRGPALDYDDVIAPVLERWMDEADICDELVAKVDGSTEPRYKSDGWAYLSTDPAEVIQAILATCDGWLSEDGDGTLALYVGRYVGREPAVVFTDAHIFGLSVDFGVADEQIVNEVQFTYTAAQANWRDVPGVSLRDEESIEEIGNVRSQRTELTWVQSHSQGRRLVKRVLARNQARLRGTLVTGLYGLRALGKRWVRVQSTQVADLSDAVIEISKVRIDLAEARVTFEWVSVNPNEIDAWDPDEEEGEPPAYFSVPENVTAADSGAGNEINIELDELDPEQNWLWYVIDYRAGTSGPWTRIVRSAETELDSIGGDRVRLRTGTVAPGTYSVRVASTGRQVLFPTAYTAKINTAVAATTNITLSGEYTLQGVALVTGDRVLAMGQTSSAQNGIWVVDAGAWARAADMNTWAEVVDASVPVSGGTFAGRTFYTAVSSTGTIDTTPIAFSASIAADVRDPDLVWAPDVNGVTGVVVS